MKFVIAISDAGRRLDVWLAHSAEISRTAAAAAIKAGEVTVNGQPAKPSQLLEPEDRVSYQAKAPTISVAAVVPDMPVLCEDDDLMIINKPAGIAVQSNLPEPTVADFARSVSSDPDPERPGIVHRLDRETSGLLIIAKTGAARVYLQKAFKEHRIKKTYTALLHGRLDPASAEIRMAIARDPKNPTRRSVQPGGKEAITGYEVLCSYPGFTLVEASPKTGRTHQLRVHFASLGHPIAGDKVYSHQKVAGLSRQFLHASGLSFVGPSGQAIDITSHWPPDLEAFLNSLVRQV